MPRKPKAIPTPSQRTRQLDAHAHEPGHLIESITKTEFDDALIRYRRLMIQLTEEETAKIRKTGGFLGELLRLDRARYVEIPQTLQERKRDDGSAWLGACDVVELVEWQIQHAGLRANIGEKARSNKADSIQSVTRRAFDEYEKIPGNLRQALDIITTLDGVSIETASLWLAVYDPEVPFLSPELYRWTQWNGEIGKKASGWKQPLKYSHETYSRVRDSVTALRHRLSQESGKEVSVIDIEKVGWVLQREAEGFIALESDYDKRKRLEAEEAVRLETTYQHLSEAEAKEAARLLLKPTEQGGWATGLKIISGQEINRCWALAKKEWGPRTGGRFGDPGEAMSEDTEAQQPQPQPLTEGKLAAKVTETARRSSKRKKGLNDGDGNTQRPKRVSK
jgi:hypothetical protein